MIFLKQKGIATGCHYTPLSLQPLFKPHASACPLVEREHSHLITLPLHVDLANQDVVYIIDQINSFINE